jgi:galactoside O-acetyltransferase
MPIKNAIHSQQVYDPTDESIMAEQELCMERLYDYNHTRPSEHAKRAQLLKEMLAECGAGSDHIQRKTGSRRFCNRIFEGYNLWLYNE